MNIGFDGKRAEHNSSGLGNYSRDVIKHLATFHPENSFNLYSPKPGTLFEFNHPSLSRKYPTTVVNRLASSLWRRKGIVHDLRKDQIELYHGLSNELPSGISAFGGKSIVTIHDLIFEHFPEYYSAIDRKIYKEKTQSALKEADVVIAISEQTKKDLVDIYGAEKNKIRVVYQSCHAAFQKKVKPETVEQIRLGYQLPKQYFLQVGTLEPRKNALTSLRALALLDKEHLVFIGKKTDHLKELEAEIERLELGQRVHFLENVPVSFLPALYAGATASLYPSFFEGFGIPIIESLFSGTPVITNKEGCFAEGSGKHALYVDVKDAEALSGAMKQMLNAEVQTTLMKGVDAHLSQFTDRTTTEELMKVYSDAMNAH